MTMRGLKMALLAFAVATAAAQSYNPDEWYDPTDWFDGNNYEYDETLDLDYGTGEGYLGSFEDSYMSDIYWDNLDYDYNIPEWNDGVVYNDLWNGGSGNAGGTERNEWRSADGTYRNRYERQVIAGRVDELRRLDLRDRSGKRDSHDVVHVTMRNGQTALIDLGPAQNRKFHLAEGDWLRVLGEPGRISGRQVLFGDSATIDGQTYRISRSSNDKRASLSGKLATVRTIHLNNASGETRRFVKVAFEDGRKWVLDLGEGRTASELKLTEGERIEITGLKRQVGGREVVTVNRITVNGDTVTLRHGGESNAVSS